MDAGRAPTLTSGALLKLPAPSPNRIQTLFENETLFEVALAMAKSCLPSLLKSPTTTEAPGPTLISGALLKLPAPSPNRIETFVELLTAKSWLPSLLKSPIAMDRGELPTLTSVVPLKLPAPSPNRTETVVELELAVTKSCLPSLLKSPSSMENG